ncbi:MAG TPA: hypothetical protein VFV46_09950, partial [Lacibacter sp.]|nr:hypothetical protein [Lacibacter sp.]
IHSPADKSNALWIASDEMNKPARPLQIVPFYPPFFNSIIAAWKAKDPQWIFSLSGTEKKKFETLFFKHYPELPEALKKPVSQNKQITFSASFNNFGALEIVATEPLSDEKFKILHRFGNVFNSSYTRFHDLQKAEAQAREAQIEVAVERVRAEAMAMHSSRDFGNVSQQLLQQVKGLGIKSFTGATIYFIDENEFITAYDFSSFGNIADAKNQFLRYDANKYPLNGKYPLKEWKKGEAYFELDFDFEKLQKGAKEFEKIDSHIASSLKKALAGGHLTHQWEACGRLSGGFIAFDMISPPDDDVRRITLKMAYAFDQAYTRFLDLKKAEAQAREAQIQLALERVRARTMAMQKSDELPEAAALLFQQVQSLGMPAWSAGYCTWNDDEKKSVTLWMSSEGVLQPPFIAPTTKDELFIQMRKGAEEGKTLHVVEMGGKPLVKHYQYMRSLPVVGEILDSIIAAGHPLPTFQIMHQAYFSKGFLLFITYEPMPEVHDIFKRFANVFDQTYTRFLDLQKAEAQAREAQIEAALERVRSRTMAMHKSDELPETSHLLFEQMKELGEPVEQLTIGIVNEENKAIEISATLLGDTLKKIYNHSIDEPYMMAKVYRAWKKQQKTLVVELRGDELNAYNRYRNEVTNSNMFLTNYGNEHRRIVYAAFFSKGMLALGSNEPRPPQSLQLLERFASVFDLTYTRFLDLQKAEAQAREAEIELGLERVRARAMAMQKSDELSDLVDTVFKELTKLDFALNWCIINIIDEPSLTNMVWAANPETNKPPESYLMKFEDYPFHHSMLKAYRERKTKHVYVIEGEEKKTYDHYLFNETEWRRVPKAAQDVSRAMKRYVATFTFSNFGGLQTVGEEYLSEQNLDILSRFGKVFDLTYTRFNDLQKAEIQAREAQIEVAVERVRAKALAMHKSAEIMGVAFTMRKELEILNMPGFDAATITLKQDDGTIRLWDNTSAKQHEDGTWENTEFKFRLEDNHPDFYLNKIWSSNDRYIVVEQDKHDLKITTDWVRKHDKNLADVVVHYYKENGIKQAWHPAVALTYGRLNLDFYVHAPEPEVENILIKMAAAFDLAYKRFLDLQKAEAQAREAQIEAALERVRSRTMAMQRSEELPEVAGLLFQQVKALGVPQFHCGFNIFEIEDKECIWYPGSADGDILPPCKIPLTEHPVFMNFIESRKRGDELCVYEKEGEYQAGHYRYMLSLPVLGEMLQNMLDAGIPFPTFQIDHLANFSHGNLLFITSEHFPEMHDTFKRFAKVFEQTYTRFLDLQKAEAQAREAQIEAALERVRSRSIGMQKSDELKDVIKVVYDQLVHLNIKLDHAGFVVDYQPKKDWTFWIADEQDIPSKITHPYFESVWATQYNNAKEKGEELFVTYLNFEEKNKFYNQLLSYIPDLPQASKDFYLNCPALAATTVLLDNVGLYIENFEGIPYSDEYNKILKRFGKVFEQTYTRFLDLQKAEAQAREAQIEAALERVRSKTMAMHNSNDVGETAAVMVDEL